MMSSKAKKGSSFEREFAKRLSLWWTDNEMDDVFWRSSNSGGRATLRGKSNQSTYMQAGDIAATRPEGNLLLEVMTFELKRGYPKCNIHDSLDKMDSHKPTQWEMFWQQSRTSATLNKSFSHVLITKRDRRQAMIWMPRNLRVSLGVIPSVSFHLGPFLVDGMQLDDWFECVTPASIHVFWKTLKK